MTINPLLAAILDDPADNARRLVYADWLEEHGQQERGEFIRVQIEIANACELHRKGHPTVEGFDDLIGRESYLMYVANRKGWFAVVPDLAHCVISRGFLAVVSCTIEDWYGVACLPCRGRGQWAANQPQRYKDGVVKCLACGGTGMRYSDMGPAIVAAHPIETVRVLNREPMNDLSYRPHEPWGWWWAATHPPINAEDRPWWLPFDIHRRLAFHNKDFSHNGIGYATEADARADLSQAMIAWAKNRQACLI